MKFKFKRLASAGAVSLIAAVVAPLLGAPAAFANGTPQGAATITGSAGVPSPLNSGNSDTVFSLRLPAGASCALDSANSGYAWQTFMIPAAQDPGALTFNSAGPSPQSLGTYATFKEPLFSSTGSPIIDKQTAAASSPPGPGQIVNIPDMKFSSVFGPGNVPAGAYAIGVECTSPGRVANTYWVTTMTVTTDATAAGGTAQFTWAFGSVPATAPTLTSVTLPTPNVGEALTATFTATPATPAVTGFTATATPPVGPAITATGAASPITIPGLTDGTLYTVTVHETNSVGSSPESNSLTGTPDRPTVGNLTATPGTGSVTLTWTAPATGPAPTGYVVGQSPAGGTQAPANPVAGTTTTITGLTSGTVYTFTVTPQHNAPFAAATSAPVQATPLSAQTLVQNITVTRPAGAIVLTQVCGAFGALPADTVGSIGFPSGSLPALAAGTGPVTGPTTTAGGSTTDPVYPGYPYPTDVNGIPNATYPTYCALNLGIAQYVKSGPGTGQFFAASGRLNQVTIVDTRDTDTGWNVVGTMSRFVNASNSAKTFSGSQLGWDPVVTSTAAPFTDSDGNQYTQTVAPGTLVQPNSPNASGLSSGGTLARAAALACTGTGPTVCTGGLGQAALDARLKLLIPITAVSGVYNATLTFSVI